jgi:hypothetical protein
MSEHDDALAAGVRAALAERAAGATVSADAWSRIEAARPAAPAPIRMARVVPLRRYTPLLAAAAAVIVMLVVATLTRFEDASENFGTDGQKEPREETVPPAPGTVEPRPAPEGTTPAGPGQLTPSGPAGPTADGAAGVRAINLGAATYPSTLCPSSLRPATAEFTLRSGTTDGGDVGVKLSETVYGDVSGDGRDEAVGSFHCFVNQSDVSEDVVAVLGESGGRPVVLATAVSSGADRRGWFVAQPVPATGDVGLRAEELYERVTGVAVVGGKIEARYVQGAWGGGEAHGDGYTVTARFVLDGSALKPDGPPSRAVVPFKAPVRGTLAYHAIRKADLGSLTVPVSGSPPGGEGRNTRFTVCGELFAGLAPLRDATLSGGRATVTGTDGQAKGGTVELGPVMFQSVTAGSGNEDAVAIVTCRLGDRRAAIPVLVRLVDGRPQVVDVVVPPLSGHSAVSVVHDGENHLRINWERTDGTAASPAWTGYRSDGTRRLTPG